MKILILIDLQIASTLENRFGGAMYLPVDHVASTEAVGHARGRRGRGARRGAKSTVEVLAEREIDSGRR
jgi:hypothetical protein